MNSNVTIALPTWHYDERGNLCRVFRPTSLLLYEFFGLGTVGKNAEGKEIITASAD